MKLSILLPTRNRLQLLRYAVESVMTQNYIDWEVVVSDNASTEDVAGFVASCSNERILYHRTGSLLPVTDNWNAALDRCTGDYMIMLGDDDALMPNCLNSLAELIEEFRRPDAIYAQALQFAYPGVVPDHQQGFIQKGYNAFMFGADRPFMLSRETSLEMVKSALNFRVRYGFNMQHFIISRQLVSVLKDKGSFFQSPYPDYYAANAILLAANSIVVTPEPMVMIGISAQSFGYFYVNQREDEGVAFLKNVVTSDLKNKLRSTLVPGTNMNDSWLYAMQTIADNFKGIHGLKVGYRRYRLLQYDSLRRTPSWHNVINIVRHIRFWEIIIYAPHIFIYIAAQIFSPSLRRKIRDALYLTYSAYPHFDPHRVAVWYKTIIEATRGYKSQDQSERIG